MSRKLSGHAETNGNICEQQKILKSKLTAGAQSKSLEVLRVLITGASNMISYVLMRDLAKGVFGINRELILVLYDEEPMLNIMTGIAMELKDCLLPLIKEIVITTSLQDAFSDADLIIFTPSQSKLVQECDGLEDDDSTANNLATALLFVKYAQVITDYAKYNVKVFIVTEPAHLNAYVLKSFTKVIQPTNIVCFSRLTINKFLSYLWKGSGVRPDKLRNVFSWGYKNDNLQPEINHALVEKYGCWLPSNQVLADTSYVKNFQVDNIDAAKLQHRTAISTSKAICDQLKDWWNGTNKDDVVNMCVISDGSYNVPKGIFWNFPVTIRYEMIRIKNGFEMDMMAKDFQEEEMNKCLKEMDLVLSHKSFADDYERLRMFYIECRD